MTYLTGALFRLSLSLPFYLNPFSLFSDFKWLVMSSSLHQPQKYQSSYRYNWQLNKGQFFIGIWVFFSGCYSENAWQIMFKILLLFVMKYFFWFVSKMAIEFIKKKWKINAEKLWMNLISKVRNEIAGRWTPRKMECYRAINWKYWFHKDGYSVRKDLFKIKFIQVEHCWYE